MREVRNANFRYFVMPEKFLISVVVKVCFSINCEHSSLVFLYRTENHCQLGQCFMQACCEHYITIKLHEVTLCRAFITFDTFTQC